MFELEISFSLEFPSFKSTILVLNAFSRQLNFRAKHNSQFTILAQNIVLVPNTVFVLYPYFSSLTYKIQPR